MEDKEIHEFCKKYEITKYNIINGKLNVNNSVNLSGYKLSEIPIPFNEVNGDFLIISNRLTSLKNSPIRVNGSFSCSYNDLTDLENSPEFIKKEFNCSGNNLTTLKGSPKIVNGDYYCSNNNLTDLTGITNQIKGNLYFNKNKIYTTKGLDECWLVGNINNFKDNTIENIFKLLDIHHLTINDFHFLSTIIEGDYESPKINLNEFNKYFKTNYNNIKGYVNIN